MKPDGGPAFPTAVTFDGHRANGDSGMTLRDWFAGQALAGLLACQNTSAAMAKIRDVAEEEAVSHYAYEYADRMLTERSK